jgi:hypothetical protein
MIVYNMCCAVLFRHIHKRKLECLYSVEGADLSLWSNTVKWMQL